MDLVLNIKAKDIKLLEESIVKKKKVQTWDIKRISWTRHNIKSTNQKKKKL